MKAQSLTVETQIQALGEKSRFNSILMVRDYVSERLTFEVVLRQGVANLLKSAVLAAKCSCGVLSRKNGRLRHQGFKAILVVEWVCYSFVTVSSAAHEED